MLELEVPHLLALVGDLDGVGVADVAAAQPHEIGAAVPLNRKIGVAAKYESHQHHGRDDGEQRCVKDGAWPERQPPAGGLAVFAILLAGKRVPADQSARAIDLVHGFVAGIDAQPAADAFDLLAVADVDSGRADIDAQAAIDAVAAAVPAVTRLVLAARLAAHLLVGNDDALLVEHRRLEARPRAHVGADLLARPARPAGRSWR